MEWWVDGVLYLFNPLSGALDSISEVRKQREWKRVRAEARCSPELFKVLANRGHVYKEKQEEAELEKKVRDLGEREASRFLRCHVILTYDCNLRCVYCYEAGIPRGRDLIEDSRLSDMLAVIDRLSASGTERTQVVLFGGEPLLGRPPQVRAVRKVLEYGSRMGWELEVVTNGVDLKHYVPLLKECDVSQVQVTIDGPKWIHDARRPRISGAGSHAAIVCSVDEALKTGFPVAIRVNADNENVQYAPDTAELFRAQGWLEEPSFGAYWGLTFDVDGRHQHCEAAYTMLNRILAIRRRHDHTKRISLEAWEPLQFLLYPFFLGEPRLPKFYFCGAHRNEWCFDQRGDIYFCADSVGRKELKVGAYAPRFHLRQEAHSLWREHDTLGILGCSSCSARLCCGGGCWFRRFCAVGSFTQAHCTEQVLPLLEVTMAYLHRTPELFEFRRKKTPGREEQ